MRTEKLVDILASIRVFTVPTGHHLAINSKDTVTDRMGVATRLPPKYATGGLKTYFRVGEVSLAYVPRFSFDMTRCSFD
eukprot:scaffold1451_cov75-Skeletonema_dohrnii-CCMP3373.AAC.1